MELHLSLVVLNNNFKIGIYLFIRRENYYKLKSLSQILGYREEIFESVFLKTLVINNQKENW